MKNYLANNKALRTLAVVTLQGGDTVPLGRPGRFVFLGNLLKQPPDIAYFKQSRVKAYITINHARDKQPVLKGGNPGRFPWLLYHREKARDFYERKSKRTTKKDKG